jgi:hypothetical protein
VVLLILYAMNSMKSGHKPSEVVIPDKITKNDISALVNKTKNLMLKLTDLIPQSKET